MSPRPEYEAALLKLSVPELKAKCKESNVPCTGKKSELVHRLIRPEEHQKGVKKPKDKNAPKRALSAYNFFCAEERSSPEYSIMTGSEVLKALGAAWQQLRRSDRAYYQSKADLDKVRYETEMKVYQPSYVPPVRKSAKKKKALPLPSFGGSFGYSHYGDEDDLDSDDDSSSCAGSMYGLGGGKDDCERCGRRAHLDPHNGLCDDCAEDIRPPGGCPCWRMNCEYSEDLDMFACEC